MVGIATLIFAMITTTAFWLTQSLAVWQSIPGVRRLTNLTLDSPEIQPRLIALGIALQAFKEHPLLGFGFENFKYAFDPRYDPRLLRQGFGETFFDRPHNVILEYAVGGGAIGLLAYLVLVGTIGILMTKRAELRTFAPFGVALLLAHIAQNLFLFDTFGSYLVFFILAAFVSSRSSPEGTISHEVAGERSFRGKQTAAVLIVGCVALAWVVANVGIVYANHKQYWGFNYFVNSLPEDALASYTRALSVPVNPYRDSMKKDLVSVLVQMHTQGLEIPDLALHVKESMAELERVIERHPKDYFVRISYADAATVFAGIDRNFLQQGMDAIGVALTLSPGRQQAYYILGKLDLLSGDTAGALAAMQKAIDLDPEIGESHFYFALIAFEAEKTSEAFVALETAKQLGRVPKNSGELRIVANHYADAGNYGEAIKLYNQSLEKEPADLETKLKLGIVYLYAGDKEAARRYIGEVAKATDLTKAPSYPLLKPILDELGISYKPK